MIGIRDAVTLAVTKMRARKIRLVITIFISGLLFSSLFAGAFLAQGTFNSVKDFTKEGFGERYVASALYLTPYLLEKQEVKDRAVEIYNDTVAKKKAEAKRLGIEYDKESDPSPLRSAQMPDGSKREVLEGMHPATIAAANEYRATHPTNIKEKFEALAKKYGAKTFFESKHPSMQNGDQFVLLEQGVEKFDFAEAEEGKFKPGQNPFEMFPSAWRLMSDELLKPFIVPGETLQQGSDGSIPIIAPLSAATKILNMQPLPPNATPQDKLERMRLLREKIKGSTFTACYRNQTSAELVQKAVSTAKEIEANKNKADYKRPELIYSQPEQACGPVPVTRDVRSAEVKALQNKEEQFAETFGKEKAEQGIVKFRIVGFSPEIEFRQFSRVEEIINSIIQSSLGSGWFTPISQLSNMPLLDRMFTKESFTYPSNIEYFAEFESGAQEQAFLDKESCKDPSCQQEDKPVMVAPYGSNSIAMAKIQDQASKVLVFGGLGVIVIAAVIMMGTVGRVIADSRRETAVFRAIGAKRIDISFIYILYVTMLSLLVAGFAFLVGWQVASFVNEQFTAQLTAQALVAYGAQDLTRTFSLFTVDTATVLLIVLCVLAAGLLGSIIPLLRNVRRSPIRDMRDEN